MTRNRAVKRILEATADEYAAVAAVLRKRAQQHEDASLSTAGDRSVLHAKTARLLRKFANDLTTPPSPQEQAAIDAVSSTD